MFAVYNHVPIRRHLKGEFAKLNTATDTDFFIKWQHVFEVDRDGRKQNVNIAAREGIRAIHTNGVVKEETVIDHITLFKVLRAVIIGVA